MSGDVSPDASAGSPTVTGQASLAELRDLERRTVALRTDLAVVRADIAAAEAALQDVTPLRRHLKRTVRERGQHLDAGIRARLGDAPSVVPGPVEPPAAATPPLWAAAARRADAATLAALTAVPDPSATLRSYLLLRRAAVAVARRGVRGARSVLAARGRA